MKTTDVQSPVTGSVWKLFCKNGDTVAAGDELAILESMKMEFPVSAEVTGKVVDIAVQEGSALDEDALICRIEEI